MIKLGYYYLIKIMEIVDKNTFQEHVKSDGVVIVDFFADWCGPCQMLVPILEDIQKELGEKVKIVKVDVDASQDLAQEFSVSSIPTLVFFIVGEAKETVTGFQSKDALLQKIEELA